MNVLKETSSDSRCTQKKRALWKMAEGRFASACYVEEFILEQESKNTAKKTERDVRLLERSLKTKNEDRKIEDIPAVELNEYTSQFIISVRTKDGNEYEPTSLRSLVATISVTLLKHCRYNCVSLPLPLGNVGKKFQPNWWRQALTTLCNIE